MYLKLLYYILNLSSLRLDKKSQYQNLGLYNFRPNYLIIKFSINLFLDQN